MLNLDLYLNLRLIVAGESTIADDEVERTNSPFAGLGGESAGSTGNPRSYLLALLLRLSARFSRGAMAEKGRIFRTLSVLSASPAADRRTKSGQRTRTERVAVRAGGVAANST
jgi:hypothetical protein